MPSPSKAKGNSYERQVADFLTDLYGEKFIRAPGSGAYVGGKNQARKQFLHEGQIRNFKGDIVPGQIFPKLNAECKSYKDFPFHQLFQGQVKILESWIEQCMDVADPGDFNLLFMKFNRKGTFVAFEVKHLPQIKIEKSVQYETVKQGSWIFMDFDTFFELNADVVKDLCK